MSYNPAIHHRRSIRIQNFDYSKDGSYFITLCTKDRKPYFGEIINGKMILSQLGEVARQYWLDIPQHFPDAKLDEFVIMPNHIHGIIIINKPYSPTQMIQYLDPQSISKPKLFTKYQRNQFQKIIPRSIGSIIRGFKIGVTKWVRYGKDEFNFLDHNTNLNLNIWQRNYFEKIINNKNVLDLIRKYIQTNPLHWKGR